MKSVKLLLAMLLLAITANVSAQDKTESFKVSGVCSMCKKKIEKAAYIPGVKTFEWNEDSKIAKITYNSKLISVDAVQKKIASIGYDTEKFKADDKSFAKLPGCCKYERKSSGKNEGA